MRTTHVLLGMLALSGGLVITAGCSSDPDPLDLTGAGGNGTGGATTSTGGNGTGGTGGTGGGPVGDGNDSFEEAKTIATDGTELDATLDPPATDSDFYTFEGDAERLVAIFTDAKPEADEFDPTFVDLVITLYDQNQQQIARNDDPYVARTTNDSLIWTVLPETGTYYIKVEECTKAFGGEVCAPVDDITNLGYKISVLFADPAAAGVVLDGETGDDDLSATPMKYVTSMTTATGYGTTFTYGFFTDETDVDVFEFTVPDNPAPVTTNDLFATFYIFGPEGPDGMGTTRNVGNAWITDSNGVVISQIDNTLGVEVSARDISAEVEPGQTYHFWVEHPGSGAGGHDFYIVSHVLSDTNPLEMEDATNDALLDPEDLTSMPNGDLESAFVKGTLADDADTDHYRLTVPSWFDASTDTMSLVCGAHRSGSGIRDLMISVIDANGTLVSASMTETEDEDLVLSDVTLGASDTVVAVKIESAAPHAAGILSNFYQCGFHFVPGMP